MLLKRLCEAQGVSGSETDVRKIIEAEIKDFCDDLTVDTMGNLIAFKSGKSHKKKVMLAAHMDEVGFIVSGVTDKGYLEFKKVGGIDTRVIISKKVFVGKDKIPGVIGIKAVHLLTKTERKEVPKVKSLYIDIGAKDKEDALKTVKLGDYVTFDTEYADFGEGLIKAKAIDDRAGCAVMIDLMKNEVEYDTYFCFTAQEEVGTRGARVAAYNIEPDIALVLEATTCADVHASPDHAHVTELGKGVALSFMDRVTIVNKKMIDYLELCAEGTAHQLKQTTMGGNDAGAIHLARTGVPTASISIPCRYLHSPVGVASKADIDSMRMVAQKFLEKIREVI